MLPVLAQNMTSNQIDYQKLQASITGIQINLAKINYSIDQIHSDMKNYHQDLSGNINATRTDAQNEYYWSVASSGVFAAIAFLGGVVIAVAIHNRQKEKQDEITTIISKVEGIATKQDETAQEIKEDLSLGLNSKLELVILNLQQCIDLFELRNQETNPVKKVNFMRSMLDEYNRCYGFLNLELNLIELMRIFGRITARQYWSLLSYFAIHYNIYVEVDDDLQSFMWHVNDCLGRCLDLNEIILPMVNDQVRPQRQ